MNRFLTLCVMLVGCWMQGLRAQVVTGTCGKNGSTVKWELDEVKGLLLIGGEGEMQDFGPDDVRWNGLMKKIRAVRFGPNVTSVGNGAFKGCKWIQRVSTSSSLKRIGISAFEGCFNLKTIDFQEGMICIEKSAFKDCKALINVVLPTTVDSIKDDVFAGCMNLKNIKVHDENKFYSSQNGMLFDKGKKMLLFCGGKRGTVRLPKTVEVIYYDAFSMAALSKIYFPTSVTTFNANSLPVISELKGKLDIYLPCEEPPYLDAIQKVGRLQKNTTTTWSRGMEHKTFYRSSIIETKLHVKKGSKQKYMEHPVWKRFFSTVKGSCGLIKGDIR